MIDSIVKLMSYFYPNNFIVCWRIFNRLVKTQYVSRKFKECGSKPRFFFPVILKGEKYISLGDSFSADKGLILQCWDEYNDEKFFPEITIGENAHLGEFCHIAAINKINIGKNLLTGRNVYISDHSHGKIQKEDIGIPPIERSLFSKGPVIIGDNVWIGDNVSILPGVNIGNNVIIGANAVVTHDILDNSVVAGVPATVIKFLEMKGENCI